MCMSPLQLYYNFKEDKYQIYPLKDRPLNTQQTIIVACGRCPECKAKWRTQLAQRVRYELNKYSYNQKCFLTLTVDDEHIDEVFPNGSLNHSYFQKFMKRLRRHLEYRGFNGKIKYLCTGEYGEKNGRPHFHVILFGWKPTDLKFFYKSKKGYPCYKSCLLEDIWKAGFVDVGDVDEHTAPYMVKYITKFSEIKSDEFYVNGNLVRKPYIVYPKTILGIDFFLENFKQILSNGYLLDSRGKRLSIPRSFLKYAENSDNIELQEFYNFYKERQEEYINACVQEKINEGYKPWELYELALEEGRVRRKIYNSFKDKNR